MWCLVIDAPRGAELAVDASLPDGAWEALHYVSIYQDVDAGEDPTCEGPHAAGVCPEVMETECRDARAFLGPGEAPQRYFVVVHAQRESPGEFELDVRLRANDGPCNASRPDAVGEDCPEGASCCFALPHCICPDPADPEREGPEFCGAGDRAPGGECRSCVDDADCHCGFCTEEFRCWWLPGCVMVEGVDACEPPTFCNDCGNCVQCENGPEDEVCEVDEDCPDVWRRARFCGLDGRCSECGPGPNGVNDVCVEGSCRAFEDL